MQLYAINKYTLNTKKQMDQDKKIIKNQKKVGLTTLIRG